MAETKKAEVVISGIAGIFPESDNVEELKDLLFSKKNGITLDSRRWPLDQYGIKSGVGKVKSLDRFDNVFFNMHGKLVECSETVIKLNLERSVEAIIDAGLNPGDLHNTNTAVFTCSSTSETDTLAILDNSKSGFAILGHNKAMQANRLSYVLNLNGPSFTILSSFTGGVDAIVMAKHMIENGHIRTAIIGSCNLVQRPNLSLQMKGLGVLNNGLETRSFSEDADGFNRSESCVAILLQNSLDAKRSYGTIVNVKMEQYGNLRGVFTNYSTEHYKKMIKDAYEEAGVDPVKVAYIEADGSAIKDVDAMELDIIKDIFCPPHRKEPLKIGSVKSNLGHTDASAGLVSIIKSIIAMDTGFIPPNINYTAPSNKSDAITSGKLQVVTEKTPLNGDFVGLNIFGRTGNYGHIIMKKYNKQKKKIYAKDEMFDDDLPRLILVSGHNDVGVRKTIKIIESYNVDEEYASLLHNVFSKNISAHFSRSFFIIPTLGPWREKDVFSITNEKPQVWFVFSGMGSQWLGMGAQLLRIPIFAQAIEKCDAILRPLGIDIVNIMTSLDPKLFDNILNSFVGISAIQIGLVDILKALDIEPDGMIGHSVGELGCAYADGCFTAEEMIMAAYARGRASLDTTFIDGMMAAVGLGYQSIKNRLPSDIDVACHNSNENCTISGPTASVMEFVKKLQSENIFAKSVNVSNISFHSRYIKPGAPKLLEYLTKIVPNPKPRSSRWLSTSVPESKWDTDLARYCSAEYHTNNLLSPVLFEETCTHIPSNAIVIEIAPHGLLQAILKRSFSDLVHIPLTQRVFGDSVRYLLTAIGKMYCNGLNPNIEKLYNPVSYPVSSGTPPLHTLCSWNHEEIWTNINMRSLENKNKGERYFSLSPVKNSSIEEYEIHGRHVLPLSALLFYIWESFNKLRNESNVNFPVVFQDVHYHQHVVINKIQSNDLFTSIQSGTGRFEVCLNDTIVLSGYIFIFDHLKFNKNATVLHGKNNGSDSNSCIVSLSHDEVYSNFEQFGYSVGDVFKMIRHADIYEDRLEADVSWDNNWIHYLDAILQLVTLHHVEKHGEFVVPVSIQEISIDSSALVQSSKPIDFAAQYNIFTNEVTCEGIKISLPCFEVLPLDPLVKTKFQLREQGLIDLSNPNMKTSIDFIDTCMDIVLEFRQSNNFENVFMYPIYDGPDVEMRNYSDHILKTHISDLMIMENDVSMEQLNNRLDNSQFIVLTRHDKLSHAMILMKNQNRVHLIIFSNSPISDSSDFTVVLQQKFGDYYLSLIKKALKIDNDFIVHRLTLENMNSYDQFQTILTNLKSLDKTIYLVSKIQPVDGILSLVKKTKNVKNIRFFFVLDNSAPGFSTSNPFYSKQLAKDLLVNVYQNSRWVTYKEFKFTNVINTKTSIRKTLLTNLSNISLKNISVKYIGLNPQDTSIDTKNNNIEYDELGPIEYSGVASNGSLVMGIAPFVPMISDITVDPILSWTVPKHISLEEASTIPVPYSMAYYILFEISKITKEDSVLVHSGLTAVGRAAIDVCLEKKCQVFVTVSDSKQMELLKQRFPSLPHSNVIIYDKENFEIKFLMANNKMNVIINCLDGEDFHATIRVIADHGKFFQLTKSDMKKKYKMGLLKFLKDISFFSVSMDRVISECKETKQTIQKLIEHGLQNGTIKPFDRYVLTGVCTGTQALETLEKLTRENEFKRAVISTEKANNTGNVIHQFQCCPDQVYFVIGNEANDWLYLVEWLVQRGALKVVVGLEKYSLTPKISQKFNILLDRYKGITVQLVSQSLLNTEQSTYDLLKSSIETYPLAAVFFVNGAEEKMIENMQMAMGQIVTKNIQKTLFVCLFCGGANTCEQLKAIGVNALCLSWAQNGDKPKLSKIIPILENVLLNTNALTNAVVVCSEHVADKFTSSKVQLYDQNNMFLPSTVEELGRNSKYITVGDPNFVEVATKSILYAEAKGTYPIFVMPGFQPNCMINLYKNLGYPTFEARYPSKFESIKSVASALVKKLKQITEHRAVTLIGESWGGTVALVMAQILEAEGILVSLSLLNGVPSTLLSWISKNLTLNDNNINMFLLSRYLSIDCEMAKKMSSQHEWNTNINQFLQSSKVLEPHNVYNSLNMLQTQLNTLIELKPLPNKLLLIPQVFISNELSDMSQDTINEFCNNQPVIHITTGKNIQNLLKDANVIKTINENVAFDYPHTSVLSLNEKYSQHYFNANIQLSC
ncbi:fatty acid synthase-like [Melanaphis sacchari]|uniref:fatty acid synthase-like n=1 Tax=Melanaphis sacchari TaxID=742174 RepID=UPI000DC15183|nr:fatty acid synthase-like [Melanaphis sacchari]